MNKPRNFAALGLFAVAGAATALFAQTPVEPDPPTACADAQMRAFFAFSDEARANILHAYHGARATLSADAEAAMVATADREVDALTPEDRNELDAALDALRSDPEAVAVDPFLTIVRLHRAEVNALSAEDRAAFDDALSAEVNRYYVQHFSTEDRTVYDTLLAACFAVEGHGPASADESMRPPPRPAPKRTIGGECEAVRDTGNVAADTFRRYGLAGYASARRSEVLRRYISGCSPEQIAVETGFKLGIVTRIIGRHEVGLGKHERQP